MVAVANKLQAHTENQNALKSLLKKIKDDPLGYPHSDEKAYDKAQVIGHSIMTSQIESLKANSGDLNSKLVQYSDWKNLLDSQMVCYSDAWYHCM